MVASDITARVLATCLATADIWCTELILHHNPVDVGSTVGWTVPCYPIQIGQRDARCCSCGSMWEKFERGIKKPGAFGGTTEMTQVTMMKV
jgi:hypothetical protein